MKQATNCFLIRPDGKILLSLKKRGLGVGKYNGAGGKVQKGETVEQAAIREVEEEIGVKIAPADLVKLGEINFRNPADPDWGMFVHLFVAKKWHGEPTESEEMKPKWFEPSEVARLTTWPDMPHYFPFILKGEKFKGEFVYKSDAETLDHFKIGKI